MKGTQRCELAFLIQQKHCTVSYYQVRQKVLKRAPEARREVV